MKKPKAVIGWVVVAFVFLAVAIVVSIERQPTPKSYSFVTVDHPVDMWQEGSDVWAYYSLGEGSVSDLAELARKDLLADGYTEDTSQAPWFRFEKGATEVVVCNHSDFAVNPSGSGRALMHSPYFPGKPTGPWPCVLVKNGPGTEMPLNTFKVKKLLHGW